MDWLLEDHAQWFMICDYGEMTATQEVVEMEDPMGNNCETISSKVAVVDFC